MRKGKRNRAVVRALEESARTGNGFAACRLGERYQEGNGVEQSWEEAFRWYSLGARAGEAQSQNNLGCMYGSGHFTPKDEAQAIHWYTLSAAQGNAVAQFNLGQQYLHGRGVPPNYVEAMRLFEASAAQDYALAINDLGAMYLQGHGTARDLIMAATYFLDAAVRGDDLAVTNLGALILELEDMAYGGNREAAQRLAAICFEGCGVPKNLEQGYAWVLWAEDLARASGIQAIESLLDREHATPYHLEETDRKRARQLFRAMKHEQSTKYNVFGDEENTDPRSRAEHQGDLEHWHDVCRQDALPCTAIPDQEKGDVILELVDEAGGITLYGIPGIQGRELRCELNDNSACLPDKPAINRFSEAVGGWQEAGKQLDATCPHWYRLLPVFVHPDFRKEILETVERKFTLDRLGIGLEESNCSRTC